MALLMGVMMIVESARMRPNGPMGVRQIAVGGSNQVSVGYAARPVPTPAPAATPGSPPTTPAR